MKKIIIVATIVTIALIFILIITFLIGAWRFNKQVTKKENQILEYTNQLGKTVTEEDINVFPNPVRNWLKSSGIVGQKKVSTGSLKQKGEMKLNADDEDWMKAEAKQVFSIDEPAFVWSIKTSKSGIPVYGEDLYINGKGSMVMKLAALFPVVNIEDNEKINKAALQRYLAEMIWFPSAFVDNEYITWKVIDNLSATATMNYQGIKGDMTFYFKESGKIERVEAMRYKGVEYGDKEEKWIGYIRKNNKVDGIVIPTEVDIAWHSQDEEEFIWYKFEVYDMVFH
ncbi:hypothetical protein EW093_06470 [Thiospirochaeta perfilievii]|uniref:Uncharacterized protein n=1 Tax=Thiospirochaeta perfilievii TaxID=252967 RepID=A0A5C1QAJ2_9SPIO|nr:DUF6544 family protein [Thiospirochaeta perfilievii]QEN04358.1 hypothetical protein EW093_06470 [Thiospirochaeta perfilievii]